MCRCLQPKVQRHLLRLHLFQLAILVMKTVRSNYQTTPPPNSSQPLPEPNMPCAYPLSLPIARAAVCADMLGASLGPCLPWISESPIVEIGALEHSNPSRGRVHVHVHVHARVRVHVYVHVRVHGCRCRCRCRCAGAGVCARMHASSIVQTHTAHPQPPRTHTQAPFASNFHVIPACLALGHSPPLSLAQDDGGDE